MRLLVVTATVLRLLSLLAAGFAFGSEGAVQGKVDVFLTVHANHERGRVGDLLADTNVALLDQHTSMVNGLGQTLLENFGLQSAIQELLGGQLKHVVEFQHVFVQESVPGHATQKCLTLEDTLGVLLRQGQKNTGCLTHMGEDQLAPPDFTFALQAILPQKLHFPVQTFLFERATRGLADLARVSLVLDLRHVGMM